MSSLQICVRLGEGSALYANVARLLNDVLSFIGKNPIDQHLYVGVGVVFIRHRVHGRYDGIALIFYIFSMGRSLESVTLLRMKA